MKKIKLFTIFLFILGFGSVFEQFYPFIVDGLAILCSLFLSFGTGQKLLVNRNYTNIALVIFCCAILSAILTGSSPFLYNSFFVRPIIAILVLNGFHFDYSEIRENIYRVLNFICWLAVANFFVVLFFGQHFPVLSTGTGYQVHTFGFVFNWIVYAERMGLNFARNQGIFWEPGVLEILMNVLIYIIWFEHNEKFKKALIPIFVLISTASTSGYMLLMALMVFWYFKNIKNSKHTIITAVLSSVFLLAFVPLLQQEVEYKTTTGIGTTNKRKFDFLMGFEVASHYPLTGIGPDPDKYIKESGNYWVWIDGASQSMARGNSNIFSGLFAKFGFPMAILFILGLLRQNIFTHKKVFSVILIVGLMSEPIAYVNLYFLYILSSGRPKNRLKRLQYEPTKQI